jgi:hypothetical protein
MLDNAGYDPKAAHLGAPVSKPLPSKAAAAVMDSLAGQVYKHSLADPDIAYNERESIYRRAPPVLVAPTFTTVQGGGYSGSRSIVVGLGDQGGLDFHARLPVVYADGNRMEVGDGVGQDLLAADSELPMFRPADGKLRDRHGAQTIRRIAQQDAAANKRRDAYRKDLGLDAAAAAVDAAAAKVPLMGNGVGTGLQKFPPPSTPPSTPSSTPYASSQKPGLGNGAGAPKSVKEFWAQAATTPQWLYVALGIAAAVIVVLIITTSVLGAKSTAAQAGNV